ncbi:hypothetical protein P691DRAFT_704036 [Macrolepiota fuliginosa MF-IS2]|uniref:Uncharacterized protein n=1 Tax=Macrolepiota fuliginosa MF-IS2 TaxID=1400762 RepID=A0A9P5XEM0_9AGAR|nr:hypothetical protein P691DRAFT_704036 [Macrolepiota fuliginosa MF-IS2]
MTPESLSMPTTPPLPSNGSTDDEDDSQACAQSHYRPTFHEPLDHDDSNGEEELDSEGAAGGLRERLFLRAETDRLLAHADSLSARMALQSYYRSMGYGVPEFGSSVDAISPASVSIGGHGGDHDAVDYAPASPQNSVPLNGNMLNGNVTHDLNLRTGDGYVAVGVGRGQMDEGDGDGRTGDYPDHASQQGQGNTKKRKVPANVGGSPPHHHHHHMNHYSSRRGTLDAFGGRSLGYGEDGDVEGDEGEFRFGLGFGLDPGGAPLDDPRSGHEFAEGVESDVFGPLPGSTGVYQHQKHQSLDEPNQQLPPHQLHIKAKLSPATLAGLQRKELIKNRKKQLKTIMKTLPVGDDSALDHALSANFPPILSSFSSAAASPSGSPTVDSDHGVSFSVNSRTGASRSVGGGESNGNWEVGWGWGDDVGKEVKVRLSKRDKLRIARVVRMGLGRLGRHPDAAPFPAGDFTFSCPSNTTKELVAMQAKVANLRNLFGAELARQAAKAAKSATGTTKGGGLGKLGKKRAQQRARTMMNAKSGEQQAEFLEMPQKGSNGSSQQQAQPQQASPNQGNQSQAPTPKKGKKKKRSTMANASNPHHLRNYVPSRLPHHASGGNNTGGNHGQNNQTANANSLWPLALQFLSAEVPPRRRKGANGGGRNGLHVQSLPQLAVPQEEWICSFCEYSLFYGDEVDYRRAVKNRKKILKRRRRARERAAAAASGVNAAMKNAAGVGPIAEKTHVEDEEYDGPGYEAVPTISYGRVDGTGRMKTREPPG